MRRLSLTAALAVPFLLFAGTNALLAHPPVGANFGCAGYCFKMFPFIHQHGPLFNYGPYYGYYPFTPYGPWDEYLRYDPNFYGDSSAGASGNFYGLNPRAVHLQALLAKHGGGKGGCSSCGFHHASWLQGGWFRGHEWLDGGHGWSKSKGHGLLHGHLHGGCSSCGGLAVVKHAAPCGDPLKRCSGIGDPAQSAVFYAATPTLDPTLDVVPTAGYTK